jgi:guanylate kinase
MVVEFPALKAGRGRSTGYRMTTAASIERYRQAGDIIWAHERYGATYAIDRGALVERLNDRVPVVQVGQADAVRAVVSGVPAARWVIACLWCPRDVAERRIVARGTGDVADRLRAWDETEPLIEAHVRIDTATTPPEDAATTTLRLLMAVE